MSLGTLFDPLVGTSGLTQDAIDLLNRLTEGNDIYGSGLDGDVTVTAASPVTLTRDMHYNNLTIEANGIINAAGFKVFVAGTLTGPLSAIIRNNGVAAAVHTGGTAVASKTLGGSAAGATGDGDGGAAGSASTPSLGGAGGGGGAGATAAGAGGAVTAPLGGEHAFWSAFQAATGLCVKSDATVALALGGAGGGAGGGDTQKGGGGGSGGGGVFVAAKTWDYAGALQAKGGAGGNGETGGSTNVGGGGGGGGGWVRWVRRNQLAAPTVDVSGGAGGAAVGTGLAGTAGAAGTHKGLWA
jgi:hypothetical protein